MKNTLLKQYHALAPDWMDIGLRHETKKTAEPYFCTPKGAEIFASLGVDGVHYCTIPKCGETVFVIRPSDEPYVLPVANNFEDFLRVVLALHGTNILDQLPIFSREKAEAYLKKQIESETEEAKAALRALAEAFSLTPMEDPLDYVASVANSFDMSKIRFTAEYYDVLGLDEAEAQGADFVSTIAILK